MGVPISQFRNRTYLPLPKLKARPTLSLVVYVSVTTIVATNYAAEVITSQARDFHD